MTNDAQMALYAAKGMLQELPEEDRSVILAAVRDAKAAFASLGNRENRCMALGIFSIEAALELEAKP